MKYLQIKYENLGQNLTTETFEISSNGGDVYPNEIPASGLLSGTVLDLNDNTSRVFITPKVYDLIVSGNSNPQLSGLKFLKVNDTEVYGFNNYSLVSTTTGGRTNSSLDSVCINDSGNIIAAGTTQTFLNDTGIYIYTGSSIRNSWQLKQTILHSESIGTIGASLSINNNGSVLLTTSTSNIGYGIIYTGSATNGWSLKQILSGNGANYGKFSAINSSGDIIVITAGAQDNDQNQRRAYIYTGNLNNWNLKQIISGSFGFNFGPVSIDSNGRTIVLSDRNNSSTLIYTGSKNNGWNLSTTISGSLNSAEINNSGDILLINDPNYSTPEFAIGAIKIYTGLNQNWNLKQVITGEDFNGYFGSSTKIKNNVIISSAPNIGKISLYVGSKTLGWSKLTSFQEDSNSNFGQDVSLSSNQVAVSPLRRPRVGDAGSYTAGLNIYNYTSASGTTTYYSSDNNYALWKNPTMRTWSISSLDKVGQDLTSPTNSFITNENGSLEGIYTATTSWSGSLSISNINNKLRVYNLPGITGFAGTYTSGTYTIGGIPRKAFRNDQNSNFYIYKNENTQAWRAVEELYNGPFTWYSNFNVSNDYPSVNGWQLGGEFVMSPPPGTNTFLPLPEMNFGTYDGQTLLYKNYIFETYSLDKNIDGLKFYDGGNVTNYGTSTIFPTNIKLKDLLPDIQADIFVKNFYYTDYGKNGNRYFLFRTLNQWVLTDLNGNYKNPGYYYWVSNQNSYFYDSGKNTLTNATGVYLAKGTNISGLENITIKINPFIEDSGLFKNTSLNFLEYAINPYSGIIYLEHEPRQESSIINQVFTPTGNPFYGEVNKNNIGIITGRFNRNSIFSGNFYTGIRNLSTQKINTNYYLELSPQSNIELLISGRGTGNFVEWFSAPYAEGPYSKFNLNIGNTFSTGRIQMTNSSSLVLLTGKLPYTNKYVIFSGNDKNVSGFLNLRIDGRYGYITGTPVIKNITIKNFNGFYELDRITTSGQYSGLQGFIGYNYVLANPEFKITEAKSLNSGTSLWTILDSNLNYTQWKNFNSNPLTFESKNWMSGSGMFENMLDLKYIPLYSYDNLINDENGFPTKSLLNINTGYNYSNVSGIFGLTTGQTFVFNFFNDSPLTGTIVNTSGYLLGLLNVPSLPSNNVFIAQKIGDTVSLTIDYENKNLQYKLIKSGNNATLYKYVLS